MPNLKGTKTEKNLMEAFAGESMARGKYTYFAGRAKKAGFEQIAAIFLETAFNEQEHAKLWFKLLHGGEVPELEECLKIAAEGEREEWTEMYKRMAEEARDEGFTDIARQFEMVGQIEKEHEERYLRLLKSVNESTTFKKEENHTWLCRNCGFTHTASAAPVLCPVCKHPQAYFEMKSENY
ncbi:MAG: rubrerythrin family protein [Defluviitaleaceae bacterium]|nr:rubrerythrin family protein [Defluviitaleaceae bacterium]